MAEAPAASRRAEEAGSRRRAKEEAEAAAPAAEGEDGDSSDYTLEDEGTEDYRRGGYHAVRAGDSFKHGAYVVQSKLGWGHSSTVWLAWDTAHSVRSCHSSYSVLLHIPLGYSDREDELPGKWTSYV